MCFCDKKILKVTSSDIFFHSQNVIAPLFRELWDCFKFSSQNFLWSLIKRWLVQQPGFILHRASNTLTCSLDENPSLNSEKFQSTFHSESVKQINLVALLSNEAKILLQILLTILTTSSNQFSCEFYSLSFLNWPNKNCINNTTHTVSVK